MSYVTLRQAAAYVATRKPFRGNNVYATWEGSWYVVYSYGKHFPMYIYDCTTCRWYGNRDKYSVTTSRHQTACHPAHVHEWHGTERMKLLAERGIIPLLKARVMGEVVCPL